jgi:hypothetical protein
MDPERSWNEHALPVPEALVNIAHIQKINDWQILPATHETREAPRRVQR